MEEKKKPAELESLGKQVQAGLEGQGVNALPGRLSRYAEGHARALKMRNFLMALVEHDPSANHAAKRLSGCGDYLLFNEYYTVDQVRLAAAQFCKQHLICPLCAMRRAAKATNAYLEKYQLLLEENPRLKPYMLTFTVQHNADQPLLEVLEKLTKPYKTLHQRRRQVLANTRGAKYTELCKVLGGVTSTEVTHGDNGWHPHMHMLALCEQPPSQIDLQQEWWDLTGDSHQVDVRAIDPKDPITGFIEVLKYAMKFSTMSIPTNWAAASALKGRRLLNPFGLFWGVEVPESLTDEPLDGLPFIERFYRYLNGSYTLTGESLQKNHVA